MKNEFWKEIIIKRCATLWKCGTSCMHWKNCNNILKAKGLSPLLQFLIWNIRCFKNIECFVWWSGHSNNILSWRWWLATKDECICELNAFAVCQPLLFWVGRLFWLRKCWTIFPKKEKRKKELLLNRCATLWKLLITFGFYYFLNFLSKLHNTNLSWICLWG